MPKEAREKIWKLFLASVSFTLLPRLFHFSRVPNWVTHGTWSIAMAMFPGL